MAKTSMADRLRMVLALRNVNMSQLARDIGVTQAAVSSMCIGRSNPRADTLILICRRLNVSADYLLGLVDYYDI